MHINISVNFNVLKYFTQIFYLFIYLRMYVIGFADK